MSRIRNEQNKKKSDLTRKPSSGQTQSLGIIDYKEKATVVKSGLKKNARKRK